MVLAGVLTGVGGCDTRGTPTDKPAPANIILIVIDTLRADHLGCYGYFRDTSPNIDAFVEESVFFEQAIAPMAVTLPSHTSLFTGLYPLEHGVYANMLHGGVAFGGKPDIKTFAELARANGYTTAAFVSATPLKRTSGLDAGFDTYDQPPDVRRPAASVTDAALAWLGQHNQERFFLFVHYFDPHIPYMAPEPYRSMFQTDADLEAYLAEREIPAVVPPSLCRRQIETVTRSAWNRYDAEVRYCDEHVGRLLEALRQRGLWDNSVIIVTSDHGEGLNQHEWPAHGRTWYEQVQVPLLMRFPSSSGELPTRFSRLVSWIDVFPTVLGQLRPSWAETFLKQATGVDVLAPGFVERPLLAQRSGRDCGEHGGPMYALTDAQWRYHYTPDKPDLLFDRHLDPHELHNVAGEFAAQTEQMRRQTLGLVAALKKRGESFGPGDAQPLELDPQLQREMEALGYIGSAYEDEEDQQPPATKPASRPATSQP